jgi:hypothetical protein
VFLCVLLHSLLYSAVYWDEHRYHKWINQKEEIECGLCETSAGLEVTRIFDCVQAVGIK